LAFLPVQFRGEPALPCSVDDVQRFVQQGQGLFNLLQRSGFSPETWRAPEEAVRVTKCPEDLGGGFNPRP
jgi:hypothetical protein